MRASTKADGLCPAQHKVSRKVRLKLTDKTHNCLPAIFAISTGDSVTGFFQGVVPSLPSAAKFAIVIPLLNGTF